MTSQQVDFYFLFTKYFFYLKYVIMYVKTVFPRLRKTREL